MVEPSRPNERPFIELKFSIGGANILNAVVTDSIGQPLYTMTSDEGRCSQRDNTKVATIVWDRHSPRMVFRGKKVKRKEWLPRAGPDTECVLMLMTHASLL